MSCAKHGWTSPGSCTYCEEVEDGRRRQFVMNATIYFFDNRTYPGISEDVAEALRQRCWSDARALYETGQKLPVKVSVDSACLVSTLSKQTKPEFWCPATVDHVCIHECLGMECKELVRGVD